jgi:hypothetical protein
MGLKRMLSGKWFTRLVLTSWIICAVAILVIFKNMELIVHGQLYYYGLIFSPEWADGFRIFTWLFFIFLGLPIALSSLALVSSFFKVNQPLKKQNIIPERTGPPRGVVKVESPPVAKEVPKRVENGNCNGNGGGISCPKCKKTFGRALVMLDFHGGKNRMVSVCPYCNHVLGCTSEEKGTDDTFLIADLDKEIIQ